MSILTEGIAAIFADTSMTVSVSYGTQCARGFVSREDVPENDALGGVVLVNRHTVTVSAAAFTSLTRDTAITVDGTAYRLRDFRKVGAGERVKLILA